MIKLKVIDVSNWQPIIDYKKVKEDGVQGVILRVGHTGSANKDMVYDKSFDRHYEGFTKVGLPIGIYWFSRATTMFEALREAELTVKKLQGLDIKLPVYFDTEDNFYQASIDRKTLTDVALAFMNYVKRAGYTAGVYASTAWYNKRLDYVRFEGFEIWVAQYNTKVTFVGRYEMWQYSSVGRVDGIPNVVDMNWLYKDYVKDEIPEVAVGRRYLHLSKEVSRWRVYPLDKPCVAGFEIGKLSPSRFGGLRYEIIQDLGNGVYKIKTGTFGVVKIFAGKNTKSYISSY